MSARMLANSLDRSISMMLLVLFGFAGQRSDAVAAAGKSSTAEDPSIRTLNTPRDFPQITTRSEWENRARSIREQILVSCGLWPLPKRAPVRPVIFDKIDRDGYSIEKVYFETVPGF